MNRFKKYRIIKISESVKKKIFLNNHFDDIYESKSFIIKFYAYLPLVHSLRQANFSIPTTVLDLGCANGPFLPTLNHYSFRTIAVDINKIEIFNAKKLIRNSCVNLININLMNSDAVELPFKSEYFDLIFCLEVLEHIKNPNKALKEIQRVLKTNGIFICSLPVEIGFSLLLRTLIGKFLNIRRPNYTFKEIIRSVFLKKPGKRTSEMEHKNFDWRGIKQKINNYFKILKIRFTPINRLKNFNPIVIIKAVK